MNHEHESPHYQDQVWTVVLGIFLIGVAVGLYKILEDDRRRRARVTNQPELARGFPLRAMIGAAPFALFGVACVVDGLLKLGRR